MTGADLRCDTCGAGAANVAPDFVLDPPGVVAFAYDWTCRNGHRWWITGHRRLAEAKAEQVIESMAVGVKP